jgi:ABC-type transport system substrate-binding protein
MTKRSIVLLVSVFAAIASLTVGSAASAKSDGAAAGTVVMVHDQEPGIINPFLSTGNGYVNSLTIGPVLAAGAIFNQKAQLVPYLME